MDARVYVGPTALRATVLPARAVYLVAEGSKTGLRRAVQESCTRWGGMTEPCSRFPALPGRSPAGLRLLRDGHPVRGAAAHVRGDRAYQPENQDSGRHRPPVGVLGGTGRQEPCNGLGGMPAAGHGSWSETGTGSSRACTRSPRPGRSMPLAGPLVDAASGRITDRVRQKRVAQVDSGDCESAADE